MLIAVVKNWVVEQVADYRDIFPNTSFPPSGPSAEFLADNSCMTVTVWKPHDQITQKLVAVSPYIESGQVFTVNVENKTPEELQQTYDVQWSVVRSERDTKLSSCDWTQLPDVPLTPEQKAEWVSYRQALRDVTSQPDPFNIVWPVAPQS